MKIDFKKLAQEDKEFEKYIKEVLYKVFIDYSPDIITMLYPMYSKDIPIEVAYDTIKMMIILGDDHGPR